MRKNLSIFAGTICFVFCLFVGYVYPENDLNKLFIKAVDQKDYQAMKELLYKGADINCSYLEGKFTSLSNAASMGDLKLVKFLIQNGAEIEGSKIFPNSPIYLAISGNHKEVVSFLLDSGVSPNYSWPGRDEGTLLISATQFGYLSIVKLLVEKGADVNFTGSSDFSPLYRSIIYDHFEIFEFLLNHGAMLNKYDKMTLDEFKWKNIQENSKYLEKLDEKQKTGTKSEG